MGRDGLTFHPFKSGQMMNGEPVSEAPQPLRSCSTIRLLYCAQRAGSLKHSAANAPCNVIVVSTLQCLEARQDLALGLMIAATVRIHDVSTGFYRQLKLKTRKKAVIHFPRYATEHNRPSDDWSDCPLPMSGRHRPE